MGVNPPKQGLGYHSRVLWVKSPIHGDSFVRIIWRMKPSPCLPFTICKLAFLVLKASGRHRCQLCFFDVRSTNLSSYMYQLLLNDPQLNYNIFHMEHHPSCRFFARSSPTYGYKITLEKLFFEALHCFLALLLAYTLEDERLEATKSPI